MQAFNELADELAHLYAQSLSDYGDTINSHNERDENCEDNDVADNLEDMGGAKEEIVELDTKGDFEKMSHGRGYITLQVTNRHLLTVAIFFVWIVLSRNKG